MLHPHVSPLLSFPHQGAHKGRYFFRHATDPSAVLPLPNRERVGVRVQAAGASSPSPRPPPPAGTRETKEAASIRRAKHLPQKATGRRDDRPTPVRGDEGTVTSPGRPSSRRRNYTLTLLSALPLPYMAPRTCENIKRVTLTEGSIGSTACSLPAALGYVFRQVLREEVPPPSRPARMAIIRRDPGTSAGGRTSAGHALADETLRTLPFGLPVSPPSSLKYQTVAQCGSQESMRVDRP
jgi:hypothetical protein